VATATTSAVPAIDHHTTRHDSSPHHDGATRASWLASTMPTPMPTPVTPVVTPRRCGGNSRVATPGAGTHTPAPPRPATTMPAPSCSTDCAVAITTSAIVVIVSPMLISRSLRTRPASTITTIDPTR
jgi:hypothetical protein